MKKFFIKIGFISLLMLVLFSFLEKPITKINPYSNFVKKFYSDVNKGVKYDVFFYGSSKSYSSFNPRVFKDVLNMGSFNFGNNGQRLPTTSFVLTETIKAQKPKLAILELYNQSLKSPNTKENISFQFNTYDAFGLSVNKMVHSWNKFSLKELFLLYNKTIRNHKGWKTISTNSIDEQNTSYLKEENNGYRGWQYTVKNAKSYLPLSLKRDSEKIKNSDKLSKDQIKNIKESIAILKTNKIPALFITAPSLRELKNRTYPILSQSISTFLEDKNVKYLDLNFHIDSIGLRPQDFRDKIHLNNNGANKVSEYLAKWIHTNYNIGNLKYVSSKEFIKKGKFALKSLKVDQDLTSKLKILNSAYVSVGVDKMALILELESNDSKDLDEYSIMFHAYPDSEYSEELSPKAIAKKRKFEIWDFKPNIQTINNKKYLIRTIDTKIQKLKFINLGVYSAKGYKGLLYDKVTVKFN